MWVTILRYTTHIIAEAYWRYHMMKVLVLLVLLTLMLGACAQRAKRVEAYLEKDPPVICAKAKRHLRALKNERKNVTERVVSGVTTVFPVGLVVSILTGTTGTKFNVATGEYNDMIDLRIDKVIRECNG